MFRKLALAVLAFASIAATAPASAHGIHTSRGPGLHRHHHHHHHGFHRPVIYPVVYSCWRTVFTSFGPRRVYVCR